MAHTEKNEILSSDGDTPMTAEQLQAYEWGWGAKLMPVKDGWKIHYYSTPTFEKEPGTVFPDFAEAIAALCTLLPEANSPEQKDQARADLERLQAAEHSDESTGR